ncbi:MAG: DUF1156 domain-containing protein [Actinomycetota bacterium]|nr:DUF1156 domain-containing protein [Actinomycetota bacterium]
MTYKKKLIEVALPLAKINEESAREKSIRHGHPSTLHLWWARRPLASARAVLFASLVDDPSSHPEHFPTEADQHRERARLFDILERLVPWEATGDQRVLDEARSEILRSCDGDLPRVLDPFGGGGTIPLESLRLGLPTFSGDLNPVAVLIHRVMLQLPHRFAGHAPVHPEAQDSRAFWQGAQGVAADLERYAAMLASDLTNAASEVFPTVADANGHSLEPIAWIWVRTVRSPDPAWDQHVPLTGSWILSKRAKRPITWVEPVVDHRRKTIQYVIREGGEPTDGTISGGKGVCVASGAAISNEYIKTEGLAGRLGTALIAAVVDSDDGRRYLPPSSCHFPTTVQRSDFSLPGRLPDAGNGLGFRVQAYGLQNWKDIYSDRQIHVLAALNSSLGMVRQSILDHGSGFAVDARRFHEGGKGATAYADAIVTLLAFIIDRCVGRWNTLSIWNSIGEKIEHVFRMQTVQMTWAFAEANPASRSTGGWAGQVDWVTEALLTLPFAQSADVAQRDARARVIEVGKCMVATDPPYYDNVGYADLSDLYYTWLRVNLRDVWPDELATLLTPKAEELIADPGRAGSKEAAYHHFEEGMRLFFEAVQANQDDRFPATAFYAFKATEESRQGQTSTGWETFLQGLLDAGLTVTATWPMRTERPGGVRNFGRNSLATSVVLACRRRHLSAPMATRGEFVAALRKEMPPAIRILQEQNIAPVDMAQSAIGPGIAVFSRYARVVEADGSAMSVRMALALVNEVLSEVLSGEESEFDADTRFALTWFEQYGHNSAPFGEAETLARAKNTTVDGVVRAGVAASRENRIRLVERNELSPSWDPIADTRLTVWETTQHLIRALDSSETGAADLLARVGGGMGERARQLAYLLYGICDRKKWADEASAYNTLVAAWPEIERLAAMSRQGDAGRLF